MRFKWALFFLIFFALVATVSAHEAYVLPQSYFWQQMQMPWSGQAFQALKNPANLLLTIEVVGSVLLLLALNFVFRRSKLGQKTSKTIEKLAPLGPIFVRLAIAASLFYSALSWSFLGPELHLTQMPIAGLMRILLFAISFMILAGFFTEIAGLFAVVIFTIGLFVFGLYLLTYLNYLGEMIVLFLFGMRRWSLDKLLFGPRSLLEKWKKYETTIVRVCYGFALAYAAVNVKLLHPALTIKVINDWNLTQFHWLFPSDPVLVTLGAGLAELAIGLFIMFGFEMRLTVLISLFYITLSLLYFREMVWPHLMLYGISLNLIVQPETFTLDNLLFNRREKIKNPL